MIFSGALAHIDTLHVDWHLDLKWQVLLFLLLVFAWRKQIFEKCCFLFNLLRFLDSWLPWRTIFLQGSGGSENKRGDWVSEAIRKPIQDITRCTGIEESLLKIKDITRCTGIEESLLKMLRHAQFKLKQIYFLEILES